MLPDYLDIPRFINDFKPDTSVWLEDAKAICAKEGIPVSEFTPHTDGSNLVAGIDERFVIKIFPPFHRHQWDSEYKCLDYFQNKLSLPIPALVANGDYDGWTYLIMSKVEGDSLEKWWLKLSRGSKLRTIKRIGELMKEVHSLSITDLDIEPKWPDFITKQLETYKDRHFKRGMPEWFINEVESFVNTNIDLIPSNPTPVLLTGEYTPFNLLVDEDGALGGMIDFGDAMTGYYEYDFLGPVLFLVSGDKELFHELLNGYGYPQCDIDDKLQKRLMVLQILHRYSDFDAQLRIEEWRDKVGSVEQLMKLIFPI